jgi:uncharacterized NAD(P)/FAD-binding protein YdhS
MNVNQPGIFDIVIVGAGISSTATLLQLINKFHETGVKTNSRPLEVAVVEKDQEFWKGLPYGKRSSINSLTITTFGEFIPPAEKKSFVEWLEKNKQGWTEQLEQSGNPTSSKWLQTNADKMEKKQWDQMYIPRRFFGDYLDEKLADKIEMARQKKIIYVTRIHGESTNITLLNDQYEVTIEDSDTKNKNTKTIIGRKIVLAIGSPPVKPIAQTSLKGNDNYINDAYLPSLELNLDKLRSKLNAIADVSKRNIAIFGSNASALELVYLINTNPSLKDIVNKVVVISRSGLLPHRITPEHEVDYVFENLQNLKNSPGFDAAALMAVIEKDIQNAFAAGIKIGDAYYQLSGLVVELLQLLSKEQKKYFHDVHGAHFSKLIRRAGHEYRDAAADLEKNNILEMCKGSFQNIEYYTSNPAEASVLYFSKEANMIVTHPLTFALTVNCGGFEELDETSSPLIGSLIKNKICTVNKTNRGFEVNENFEACKNFYIIGPLLGGIFNDKARLWHVENAKSIFNLAEMLVQAIFISLSIDLDIVRQAVAG